ncbi:AraC family transcriptional regulator [Nocardia nepalensis]|uniref:AraC family transcriptional regulator n=1 Tax=Nocardia nepalensis TaxID=3375448 RepID=UPI003B67B236
MVQWDIPRSAMSAVFTTRLGEDKGVPVEVCLRDTGLTPRLLADPTAEISAAQELTVVANLVRALDYPPGLGIEAGLRYRVSSYGIWGFALISSPTLRSAIEIGLQFVNLTFAFSDIRVEQVGDEIRMVFEPSARVEPELRRYVVERDAAAVMTLQRDLLASPIELNRATCAFPAPPPDGLRLYEEVFGLDVRFDAAETMAAFDATVLDAPLPQANEHTAVMAVQQCSDLLARRQARTGLAGQIRDLLIERLPTLPDASEVAAEMHMSDRTLRHRLAEEGTSFRILVDEVRRQLAEELLVIRGLPVAEIAKRLGYLEVSSFSQAFRRWKGIGPRAYRQQHSGAARGRS